MKRCEACGSKLLEIPGESYPLLLDVEPDITGDVVMESAQTGARRGRVLADGEQPRSGTTIWSRHSTTCRAKRKKPAEPIERREPCA